MSSKLIVPLQLPVVSLTPASPLTGFKKVYVRNGYTKILHENGTERDLVLDRPLDGLLLPGPAAPVVATDTVIEAFTKIQRTFNNIRLIGDIVGDALYNPVSGKLEVITQYAGTLPDHTHPWSDIYDTPTTLLGYGITDPVVLTTGSYSDPTWITALDWNKIINVPAIQLFATEFGVNHYAGINNGYLAGDTVYYQGKIYRALFNNDAIPPSPGGNTYWQDLGTGFRLRQDPSDWNAASGDAQILNKPTNLSDFTDDLGFQLLSEKGQINGYASLDAGGRVPASQLPSYVDDVLEFADLAGFPVTGEQGKIYVALDTNKIYRWSGSTYIEISTNAITGSGTTNYVARWTAPTVLGIGVLYDDGTNVGIGTASPNVKLVVDAISNSTVARFITSDNNSSTVVVGDTGDSYAAFYLETDGGNGQLFKYGAGWGVDTGMVGLYSSNGPIALQAGGTTKAFVSAAGNLGIGTTAPAQKLDVAGTIRQSAVTSSLVKTNASGDLIAAVAGTDYQTPITNPVTGTGVATRVAFWDSTSSISSDADLYWDNINKRLGLGTASPTSKLHVLGTVGVYGATTADAGALSLVAQNTSPNRSSLLFRSPNESLRAAIYHRSFDSGNNGGLMEFMSLPTGTGTTSSFTFMPADDSSKAISIGVANGASNNSGLISLGSTYSNLRFSFNGTTRVTMLSDGNVGIGTTAPASKLHIHQTAAAGYREQLLKMTVSDAGNDAFFINNGTNADNTFWPAFAGYGSSATRSGLQFLGLLPASADASDSSDIGILNFEALRTDNATDPSNGTLSAIQNRKLFTWSGFSGRLMTMMPNGNLGIGTTTPQTLLHLAGTNTRLSIQGANAASGTQGIQFLHTSTSAAGYIGSITTTGGGTGSLVFSIGNSTSGERMRIADTGNIGIGTTSPSEKLHVEGRIRVTTVDNGTGDFLTLSATGIITDRTAAEVLTDIGGAPASGSGNYIQNQSAANQAASFRINGSGNVGSLQTNGFDALTGFGTRLPSSGGTEISLPTSYTGGWARGVLYTTAGTTTAQAAIGLYGSGTTADRLYISFGTAPWSGTGLFVTSANNVGIGLTNPGVKLDVSGDIRASNVLYGSSAFVNLIRMNGGTELPFRNSSNTELARLTSAGDFGIGTTTPSQKLHVAGNAYVTGAYYDSTNSPGTSGQVLTSTATGTDWKSLSEITGVDGTGTANYMAMWSDADTITTSGIYQDPVSGGIVLGNNSGAATPALTIGGVLYLEDQSDSTSTIMTGIGPILQANGPVGYFRLGPAIYTYFAGPNGHATTIGTQQGEAIRTSWNGTYGTHRTGINNTAPLYNLHLSNGLGSDWYDGGFANWFSVTNGLAHVDPGSTDAITSKITFANIGGGDLNTDIVFSTTTIPLNLFPTHGDITSEAMRITYEGNVGIGTSTPGAKLDVYGQARVSSALTVGNANDGIIYLSTSTNPNSYYVTGGPAQNGFAIGVEGEDVIRATNIGGITKVGIDNLNPQYTLDVAGTTNTGQLRAGYITLQYYFYNFWTVDPFDGNFWIRSTNPFGTPNYSAFLIERFYETVGIGDFGSFGYSGGLPAKLFVKNDSLNPSGNIFATRNIAGTDVFKVTDTGDIYVTGAYGDSSASFGTSGQVLSSTGTGTSWIDAPSGGGGSLQKYTETFVATASQTVFITSNTLTTSNFEVFLNGSKLTPSEYTVNTSTKTITLGTPVRVDDIIEVNIFAVNSSALAPTPNVSVITASSYTVDVVDEVLLIGSAPGTISEITLPNASAADARNYTIKNVGGGQVNIIASALDLVDGQSNVQIANQYTSLTLFPYLNNWYII